MIQYGIILTVGALAWLIVFALPLPLSKTAKHFIALLSLACSFIWFLLQSFIPTMQLALLLLLLSGLFLFVLDKKMGDALTAVVTTKRGRKDVWEHEEEEFMLDEVRDDEAPLEEMPIVAATIHKEERQSEPVVTLAKEAIEHDDEWFAIEQHVPRAAAVEDEGWTVEDVPRPKIALSEIEWNGNEEDIIPEMTFLAKAEEQDDFVPTLDAELQPLTFDEDVRLHGHHDDFFAADGEATQWSEDEWEQLLVDEEEDKKQR